MFLNLKFTWLTRYDLNFRIRCHLLTPGTRRKTRGYSCRQEWKRTCDKCHPHTRLGKIKLPSNWTVLCLKKVGDSTELSGVYCHVSDLCLQSRKPLFGNSCSGHHSEFSLLWTEMRNSADICKWFDLRVPQMTTKKCLSRLQFGGIHVK